MKIFTWLSSLFAHRHKWRKLPKAEQPDAGPKRKRCTRCGLAQNIQHRGKNGHSEKG